MLRFRLFVTILMLIGIVHATAQSSNRFPYPAAPTPTTASERIISAKKKVDDKKNSILKNIQTRNIGPTIMSGRVTDIEANPETPSHFYVAYASGGLWETRSNGATFTSLFDQEEVMTIGDIAVKWSDTSTTIWVGTGENNSSRSSYAGAGLWKSDNSGADWQYMGLPESHHISRIILHPTEPLTLWVAVIGHLYSPNAERGVYKTVDGGTTWDKVLFVNDSTGIADLTIDPTDPNTLYASSWERWRRAWHFQGAGSGSAIYKSTNGGDDWTEISTSTSGFPVTNGVGRIGLTVSPTSPQIVYALLDNQDHRAKKDKEEEKGLARDDFEKMTVNAFLKLKDKDLNEFLKENNFPKKYDASSIKEGVKKKTYTPKMLADYLGDANQALFRTPVKGAELYKSVDGGITWTKTHEDYIDDVFYSYGYYFAQVRVDPQNADKVYIMGVPILKSEDGGKNWENIGGDNVHADHHALYINPAMSGHLINGNDGGINISYDDGVSWFKANSPSVGQFYAVEIDESSPTYHVYGGLQDNGVWYGPSTYSYSTRWHQEGKYPYQRIMGGDGMEVAVDSRNNDVVYTGYQFGNYFRINKKTNKRKRITPKHDLGQKPFRWNWQTPIHLSRHNQDIFYMGSNHFHRSMDKGETFETLGQDLTRGGIVGNVPYGTLTTIHESPIQFGLIYVGSDDGYIYRSDDAGNTWVRISDSLPAHYWVSKVFASQHDVNTVYASLNGYRWDDFSSLLYVSRDKGGTWEQIGMGLPAEPINVVIEDTEAKQILYVGTDHGVYASLDAGHQFEFIDKDFPNVAVHDLKLHPEAHELVIGTHGRSIYVADVSHLQKLVNTNAVGNVLYAFDIDNVKHSDRWGNPWSQWYPVDEPSLPIHFYVKDKKSVRIKITEDKTKAVIIDTSVIVESGFNHLDVALSIADNKTVAKLQKKHKDMKEAKNGRFYLPPASYTAVLSTEKKRLTKKFAITKEKD